MTNATAIKWGIDRALRFPLSELQKRIVTKLLADPPQHRPPPSVPGHTPSAAYWRGRDGRPNVHAPACTAFACWRAGYAQFLADSETSEESER